jgi:hypothetical protein
MHVERESIEGIRIDIDSGDARRLQFTAILGNDGTHSLGHVCVGVVRRLVSAHHTSTQVSIRQRMGVLQRLCVRVVRRLVSAVITKACHDTGLTLTKADVCLLLCGRRRVLHIK